MPRKTDAAGGQRDRRGDASMRPRPDAAENRPPTKTGRPSGPRFNEAAARCRGKLGFKNLDELMGKLLQ